MQSPLICGMERVANRCGHVSIWLCEQSVQFGFKCVVGHNMFFSLVIAPVFGTLHT